MKAFASFGLLTALTAPVMAQFTQHVQVHVGNNAASPVMVIQGGETVGVVFRRMQTDFEISCGRGLVLTSYDAATAGTDVHVGLAKSAGAPLVYGTSFDITTVPATQTNQALLPFGIDWTNFVTDYGQKAVTVTIDPSSC